MRVVLDADVLVSAIARCSSRRIVQAWLDDQTFETVICDRLLGEVSSVLTDWPRLRKWSAHDSHASPQVAELVRADL